MFVPITALISPLTVLRAILSDEIKRLDYLIAIARNEEDRNEFKMRRENIKKQIDELNKER